MNGSDSGGGKVFGRFSEPAHRVLDLAREEAERCGHCYLGPEHVLLGTLVEGHDELGPEHLLLGVLEDEVDLKQLQEAAAAELGGVRR